MHGKDFQISLVVVGASGSVIVRSVGGGAGGSCGSCGRGWSRIDCGKGRLLLVLLGFRIEIFPTGDGELDLKAHDWCVDGTTVESGGRESRCGGSLGTDSDCVRRSRKQDQPTCRRGLCDHFMHVRRTSFTPTKAHSLTDIKSPSWKTRGIFYLYLIF